jgi:hypothetical protein
VWPHRYGQGFTEQLDTLKVVTEQAKAVVKAAPDTEGVVNDALMRLTQEKLFLILEDFDLKRAKNESITFIAKSIAGLARASVAQKAWAEKVRQKAEAAAAQVEKVAREGGLSDAVVKQIRREILGVAGEKQQQCHRLGAPIPRPRCNFNLITLRILLVASIVRKRSQFPICNIGAPSIS